MTLERIITLILVGIILVLLVTQACERTTGEAIVPVRVPLSSVTMIDSTPQAHIDISGVMVSNRQQVKRMQDTIDALRARIAALGGRTSFRTDTLLMPNDRTDGGKPDTIRVECDETHRRIALNYGFAPRLIDVVTPRKPFLQGLASAGVGYAIQDSALRPRIMLGALVNLGDNVDVQIVLETHLFGNQQPLYSVATADLRWTF